MVVKILVTGASGFVGGQVARALAAAGHALTLLGGTRVPALPFPHGAAGQIHSAHAAGDLSGADLSEYVDGCEVVVHVAGKAHVFNAAHPDMAAEFHRANALAVARLCNAMAQAGVGRMVLVSSIAAKLMANDYGRSKQAGEQAALDHPNIDTVALRPPLIYGPGGPGNLDRLVSLLKTGLPLPFASVDNRRSLCAVSNLAQLIRKIVEQPQVQSGLYEVCDQAIVSLPQIVRALALGMGRPARLIPMPAGLLRRGVGLVSTSMAEGLFGDLVLDNSGAASAFGWRPEVETLAGLEAVGAHARRA